MSACARELAVIISPFRMSKATYLSPKKPLRCIRISSLITIKIREYECPSFRGKPSFVPNLRLLPFSIEKVVPRSRVAARKVLPPYEYNLQPGKCCNRDGNRHNLPRVLLQWAASLRRLLCRSIARHKN